MLTLLKYKSISYFAFHNNLSQQGNFYSVRRKSTLKKNCTILQKVAFINVGRENYSFYFAVQNQSTVLLKKSLYYSLQYRKYSQQYITLSSAIKLLDFCTYPADLYSVDQELYLVGYFQC